MLERDMRAGVMGWPVEHSLSPRLHGFWLKQHNIPGTYEALPVAPDKLEQALRALPGQGFRGVNLTVPHKEAATKIVDTMDDIAKRVGAVNTVVVTQGGKLEGRNTDVYGFAQNLLAAGFKPGAFPVTLLGAGGAARAALVALIDMGFGDIRIVNRTRARAEELVKQLGKGRAYSWNDTTALDKAGLLVNATSLGLKGQPPLDIALDTLPREAWVTDMVYAPLMTDLLKRAKARGNKTIDGLGMLLHQAKPAFAAFFGVEPEVTTALRAFVLEKA